MTAAVTNAGPDTTPVRDGWRVRRWDGAERTVLKRFNGDETGWAVFDGTSTHALRNPPLGYPGSWHQHPEQCIDWAREMP